MIVEEIGDLAAVAFALTRDRDALNGRCAFLEPHSAAVTIQTLSRAIRGILEVTVTTEDLEHLIGDQTDRVDREELADSSLLIDVIVERIEVEVATMVRRA